MTADKAHTCSCCGAVLSNTAAEGLCPRCLLSGVVSGFADIRAADLPRQPQTGAESPPRFGDYEILGLIARGGMGRVYKARQVSLNRTVALKLISKDELAEPEMLDRFRLEAAAAASLDHPNIVPIFEFGESDGRHYLSMKLIEGGSLAAIMASRNSGGSAPSNSALQPRDAATLLLKIARAVHYAHQRGVLHRDIKPGNILIDSQGEPHLTDFGLAKLVERNSTVTRTLAVLGTPSYISPEQAAGQTKRITTSADVYGLGAVLYECLTGQPPFAGSTTFETIRQVLDQEPRRPSLIVPHVDRDLETICLHCLNKEPERRYHSAGALADELERWLRHEPLLARPAGSWERTRKWLRRHPATAAVLGTALLSLVAVAVVSTTMGLRLAAANFRTRAKAEEGRQQLVRLNTANGDRLVAERNDLTALLFDVEALRLEEGDPQREANHRLRIAAVLRDAPRLDALWFHTAAVNSAEFSPDGLQVVTASSDQTARIWDALTSEPRGPPLTHEAAVEFAAFSPDGRRVVTLTRDGWARIWDPASGAPLTAPLAHSRKRSRRTYYPAIAFAPSGQAVALINDSVVRLVSTTNGETCGPVLTHTSIVEHVNFSLDGKRIVTSSRDRAARIWDSTDGRLLLPPLRHEGIVLAAWFSPNGTRLATISDDSTARVWNTETGQPVTPPLVHRGQPSQCLFSPDGKCVLTASFDLTRVWDAESGQPVSPPLPHGHLVYQARFSPDGRQVVTAAFDNTVRFWDAKTGAPSASLLPHAGYAMWANFSPDGHRVLTASADGAARLWQLPNAAPVRLSLSHTSAVLAVSFSTDGHRLFAATSTGGARIYDAVSGSPLGPPLMHTPQINDARLAPDGRRVVTAGVDGAARVWDCESGKELTPPLQHKGAIIRAIWSPRGDALATASEDRAARVWNASNGQPLSPPLLHKDFVMDICFSPDGKQIVTASRDRVAQVWNVAKGEAAGPPLRHPGAVMRALFSPDGRTVLTAYNDFTIGPSAGQLWDVATGQALGPPLRHQSGVNALAFSPDGQLVATGGADNVARVWNARTGEPITPPLRHLHWVVKLAFSQDSRRLLTGSYDLTARVWDARSGQSITPPLRHASNIFDAAFDTSGNAIITGCEDGSVRVWDLPPAAQPVADLEKLAQVLAAHRLDPSVGLMPLAPMTLSNHWQALHPK